MPEIDMTINSVGVFCASSPRVDGAYTDAAVELGRAIAAEGWTTVYGGGGVGLMGALAKAVLAAGGPIVGVRPKFISAVEADQAGLTELIFTETMHERVRIILDRSDAFVALPGACGTLDELLQAVTWKRLALHNKPVVILNLEGYFDPLLEMFTRMVELRFVSPVFLDLFEVHSTVSEAIRGLRDHTPTAATMF